MDFDKLCMVFTMQEPYYGILLSAMDREANPKVTDTIAVGQVGNVFKLFYNPDFINQYSDDDVLLLLKHEVLHLAFNHFTLFKDVDTTPLTHKIANIAGDMQVNGYIQFPSNSQLKPVLPSKIGMDVQLGAREYFKALIKMNQDANQQARARNPFKPCNGGQGGVSVSVSSESSSQSDNNKNGKGGGNGKQNPNESNPEPKQSEQQNPQQSQQQNGQSESEVNAQEQFTPQSNQIEPEYEEESDIIVELQPFDDHNQWPDDDQIEPERINEIIDDMLLFAAEECEKSQGTIPGEIAGKIEKLRARRPKPVADWRRYFRRYLGNEFSELIRKSKKRESKRFPDAAGNRHRRKSHILVAIDTSGSVSMPEYHEFFGQIKTMTKDATFHVVECDARIQYEYDYNNYKENDVLHGGGGTSFQPVIDRYLEDKRKYDALVYFTDGGATIPANTPKDTLWVISSKGDHERSKYKVNGASVVIIPKHGE